MVHLQNILHANQDVSGYNLQHIPSRLSIAYRPSYNLNLPPITEPRESTNATRPLQLGPVTPDQQKLQKSNKILQVPHFSIDEGRLSIPCRPSYNLNLPPITEPGESTNAARPLQLGPVTPDQQKLQKTNNILQVPHFSIDEGLSKENNKQDNVFPPQDEIAERECNGSVCDASSSPISTMQNEKQTIDGGNDGEIDLNKTPPQKTPKRRKHRPKVVVEGKPKRTPKPKATESNTTGGNSTIKRKYIRKKGINTSTDQSIDARNGVEVSNIESQAKSCKRALNFDLENEIGKKIKGREFDHQADNIKGSTLNLNVDLHSPELEGRPASTVENVHQNLCGKGKQTENLYNFIHSVGKITPEELAVPPTSKNHTLNVLARVLNMRNANTNQSGGHGMNGQVQHHIGGSLAQILANTRKQNLDGYRQPKLLNRPQLLEDFVDVSERQESKRDYSCTEIRRPPVASQIWSHAVSGTGHNNRDSIEFWQNCLEASRTKNVEQFFGRKSSMPPSKTTLEDCSEQIQSTRNRNFSPESSKLHQNGGLPYYSGEGKSTFIDLTNETNMVIHQWCKNSTDSGHKYQKQVSPYAKQMAHRAHHFAKSQTTNSLIAVDNFHMVFASQRDSQVTKGNQTANVPTLLSTRRRAAKPMPSNIISKNLQGSRHESKKVAGAHEYNRNIFSIDDITKRMKDLHIDSFGEQNALVPYRGDGAVVPFEVFDPIKKRRPRPKVDLDPETTRLWNLLMGKEGSESAEPVDNGKQKYWEEERKVFRGRVDSFIARMHLVQGDRRFSKWKGSVVDSVIGVFLTQNVSDHLSSSAFMSLVAKFPAMRESCCQNSRNPSNEHEVIISYPDKRTSCHHPLIREPVIHHSSVTSSQQSRYKAENITSGKSFSIHNHTRRKEEECMILSQCSSESLSFQASEDIRSSSGSNSEVEDHITGSSFRKNLGTLNWYQHAERIDAFQQYEVQEMGSSFADNRPSNNVQPPENLVQNQNPGVASGRNAYSGIHRKMLMGIEEREADLLEFIGKERSHAFQQCEVQEMGSSFADNRPSNNVQPPENLVQNQNPGVASGRNAYSGIHRKMLMGIEEREADLLEFIGKERSQAFQRCEVQEMGSSFADNRSSNNVQPPENLVQNQNPGVASSRNSYSRPLTSSVLHYQRPAPPSNDSWQKMLMGIKERESDLEFIEKERLHPFQQFEVQEMGSSFADNRPSNNVQQPENLVQNQNPGVASSGNAYSRPLTSSVLHYQRPAPPSNNFWQKMLMGIEERESDLLEFIEKESSSSLTSEYVDTANGTTMKHVQDKARQSAESSLTDQQSRSSNVFNHEVINKQPGQQMNLLTESQSRNSQHFINFCPRGMQETSQPESSTTTDPIKSAEVFRQTQSDVQSSKVSTTSNARKRKAEKEQVEAFDWDTLRKHVQSEAGAKSRSSNTADSLNYEALRNADVHEISDAIKERGMNNMLAARMKDFLNRLVKDHGSMDLEWLRDVQPDKAKDYLLSIRGLGLKSVECVRLLTLHHLAFPVDTNVGRIAVRLGWVPLQPLPETLQLHLLELYPVLESIQKYLWPRLCMLDQETLYELHYQLITFGKVFCTKRQPNCNACPMRGECRHFASAFASARLALPGPEERSIVCSDVPSGPSTRCGVVPKPMPLPPPEDNVGRGPGITRNCEPIIEEPATPESSIEVSERDIEDAFYEDPDEIPEIKLNIEEFTSNLQSFIQEKMEIQEGDMSKALVALSPQFASIPMPKLKQVTRLRTEHQVYELLDSHPLLEGLDRREPDDPSPYLLAIWAPGETADSVEPPESRCTSSKAGHCNTKTCFSCNSTREAEAQTVRGTILIPCRTAMRGSFPLNGTYFQVNEVFADDETSMNPIDVPRSLIWNLPRRTVFFGTSVSTIFKGMSTEDIQYCFWKGFVCVRGFDQKTRAPRPLKARLHLAASKIVKKNE